MSSGNHSIAGPAAWAAATDSRSSWAKTATRFQHDIIDLDHSAKFRLHPSDTFFCIGSCFARNIEEQLLYRGLNVASLGIKCPRTEWQARPTGIVNKFTTHSMLNEVQWAYEGLPDPAKCLVESNKGWMDLQLAPGASPVSNSRAHERRRYLSEEYFPRLSTATVVILTLGLVEVWEDRRNHLFLNSPPSVWETKRDRGRFALHQSSYLDNYERLETMIQCIARMGQRDVRVIVTVSPVPLAVTFTGLDVLIANTYSKSVLRAVAGAVALRFANVDYFPSYELVANSTRSAAFVGDCVHVRNSVVQRVVAKFLGHYMPDAPDGDETYVEPLYLEANADVDLAVRSGSFSSGFEHWTKVGKAEGRPLRLETSKWDGLLEN